MKRALAILAVASLFGFVGLAQGSITGSWDLTFTYSPVKWLSPCPYKLGDVIGLSSNITLDYVVGGWTFESKSGFDAIYGFNSQVFSANGSLGPVTLSAKATFLPAAVTKKTMVFRDAYPKSDGTPDVQQEDWWVYNNFCTPLGTSCKQSVLVVQTPSCSSWYYYYDEEIGPAFKDFEFNGSLTFGGVSVEVLSVLDAWTGTITEQPLLYSNSGTVQTAPTGDNLYYAHFEDIKADVVQSGSCTVEPSDYMGFGTRIKLSGTVGGMTITSYTYFNMTESDKAADKITGCPVLGKKGDYKVKTGCGIGFTEEYLTVEGISLCCGMTMDAALKLVCPTEKTTYTCKCEEQWEYDVDSDSAKDVFAPKSSECKVETEIVAFDYLQFLIKGIPFIPGFYDLNASIKWTTTEKEFSLCGVPAIAWPDTCLNMTLLANWEEDKSHNGIANKFTGLGIKDITLTCEFSECSKFTAKTVLYDLPTNALATLSSEEELVFLVPAIGCECPPYTYSGNDPTNDPVGAYLEIWSTPKYKYFAYEEYKLELCGPGCCGGQYKVTIDNFIGKKYEADPRFCSCICYVDKDGDGVPELKDDTWVCSLTKDANYTEVGKLGTLFSWMMTKFNAEVPLFTDFTVKFGSTISFRGWEDFTLGIAFKW